MAQLFQHVMEEPQHDSMNVLSHQYYRKPRTLEGHPKNSVFCFCDLGSVQELILNAFAIVLGD